jgi:hypothetical protein
MNQASEIEKAIEEAARDSSPYCERTCNSETYESGFTEGARWAMEYVKSNCHPQCARQNATSFHHIDCKNIKREMSLKEFGNGLKEDLEKLK